MMVGRWCLFGFNGNTLAGWSGSNNSAPEILPEWNLKTRVSTIWDSSQIKEKTSSRCPCMPDPGHDPGPVLLLLCFLNEEFNELIIVDNYNVLLCISQVKWMLVWTRAKRHWNFLWGEDALFNCVISLWNTTKKWMGNCNRNKLKYHDFVFKKWQYLLKSNKEFFTVKNTC